MIKELVEGVLLKKLPVLALSWVTLTKAACLPEADELALMLPKSAGSGLLQGPAGGWWLDATACRISLALHVRQDRRCCSAQPACEPASLPLETMPTEAGVASALFLSCAAAMLPAASLSKCMTALSLPAAAESASGSALLSPFCCNVAAGRAAPAVSNQGDALLR